MYMKDEQWFDDRVGTKVLVSEDGENWRDCRVMNESHVAWLHKSQGFGYSYMDAPTEANVCISCEG